MIIFDMFPADFVDSFVLHFRPLMSTILVHLLAILVGLKLFFTLYRFFVALDSDRTPSKYDLQPWKRPE